MGKYNIGLESLSSKISYVSATHTCSSTDNSGKKRRFRVNDLINHVTQNKFPVVQLKPEEIRSWAKNTNPWFKKDEKFGIQDMAKHFKRVMSADIKYPLILTPEKSLMDGFHRLIKHIVIENNKTIPCIVLPKWPEELTIPFDKSEKETTGTEGLAVEAIEQSIQIEY